jgi:protease-4
VREVLVKSWRFGARALEGTRRLLSNLLLLALVGGALALWWASVPSRLADNTALVLDLNGPIVEQFSGGLRRQAAAAASGDSATAQVRLRDLVAVIDAAAKDPKIARIVLQLDGLGPAGLPTLREAARALERFKAAGKPVLAYGTEYSQRAYFLAAHADEVYLHPMGFVLLEGFGRYRTYYKDLFDRVGVEANVIRVGGFKNAAEPFVANAPSKETLEAEGLLFDAMWASYTRAVEKARKLQAGALQRSIDRLPESLAAAGGDAAKLLAEGKLIDGVKTPDEMRALLIERGAADAETKSYRQVSFGNYLARVKPKTGGDAVAVVVAEGEIVDGEAGAGRVGGVSTAALIRKAREDDQVKAIVLRVRSPGGSAVASELVRRELDLARKAGKPVVVSMGDLAASGGYWISLAADEVVADEATITGSIGVVAMSPSAAKALDRLGIHTGGHVTSWLAGAFDPRRPLDPRLAQVIESAIGFVYRDFLQLAATARKTTPEKIHEVAQGRVWTGAQAVERGLVDRLGSFGDALKAATMRAKLPDDARVVYIEREAGMLQRLLARLGAQAIAAAGAPLGIEAALGASPVAGAAQEELAWFARSVLAGKPYAAVVHCLCGVTP